MNAYLCQKQYYWEQTGVNTHLIRGTLQNFCIVINI